MSGFAVSASRIGRPDTGLISYGEIVDQGRNICAAVKIPVIGDGDTGYGNALNVKRTVQGYARGGFACVMIEDQVAPKRCGHTKGKLVVEREEAVDRIKAAHDARAEGEDILILARTGCPAWPWPRRSHRSGAGVSRGRGGYSVCGGAHFRRRDAPRFARRLPGPQNGQSGGRGAKRRFCRPQRWRRSATAWPLIR